ncbi:hypothetical protein PSHT_03764 [Puccinia striiformis]|uniref:Uncharacterized protein n=1 Tax=Puccinia striiformis TaxID=27350 RepID=A0A2S4WEM0_9BASI|nr:hypothetical protein PSHT_03764 [Puccinia striiformis]
MDAQQFAELIESFREMKTVVQRQQVQIESRDLELSQMRIEMEELKTQRSTKNSLKSMPLNGKISNQPQSEPARTSKHGSQKKQPTSVNKPVHQTPPKQPNAQGSSSGSKSRATPSATKPPPVPPQKKTQAPSSNKPGQVPPKKAKTPPAPADNKRQGLHQMLTEDYPPNFRTTKAIYFSFFHTEALYTHIRLLWGLIERRDVPTAPLLENLDRFNSHFTSAQQVLSVSGDHSSPNLIVANQVQIMKAAKGGKVHVNKKVDKIDQFSMEYMQGALSKLGLSVWRPDLAHKLDSLYNIACRMAALSTFRQLGATPAYSQLNINKVYVNDIPLLAKAYNHYVHFYMLNRYMDELKTEGHFALVEKKKEIQHNRNNLRKARYTFAVNNQYPEQYCEILERISAHSDDEKEEGNKFYTIKTLPYRSKNANKFFRRLDIDMMASEAVSSTGTTTANNVSTTPHQFPIDFYDISWYHNLLEQDKRKIPNSNAVAFLPDASQSPLPKRVPDEKLCSQRFNSKYLAMFGSSIYSM